MSIFFYRNSRFSIKVANFFKNYAFSAKKSDYKLRKNNVKCFQIPIR